MEDYLGGKDISEDDLKIVSRRKPSFDELRDLLFAWRVAKYVKSNTIYIARIILRLGLARGK